jgi:carboxymethylenebutenolidase
MIPLVKRLGWSSAIVTAVFAASVLLVPAPSSRAGFTLARAKEAALSFTAAECTIPVWRFTPVETSGQLPGVVLLYGIDGMDELQKTKMLYKTVAGKIAEKGYVVHFVHYFERTTFKPEEIAPIKEAFQRQLLEKNAQFDPKLTDLYVKWMEAVKAGIEHLRKADNVDPTRIGLMGVSMGGFLATSLAVNDPKLDVKLVANIFGALPAQQKEELSRLKNKLPPLLLMGGEDDEIVPERLQRDLFSLWRSTGNKGEAHFYGGVGHVFYDKTTKSINLDMAMNEALPTAIRFLKRHMGAVVEPVK